MELLMLGALVSVTLIANKKFVVPFLSSFAFFCALLTISLFAMNYILHENGQTAFEETIVIYQDMLAILIDNIRSIKQII